MRYLFLVFTAVLMTVSAQAESVTCEPTGLDKTAHNAYHYWFEAHQGDGLFYDGVLTIGNESVNNAGLVAEGRTLVSATIVKGQCHIEVSLYQPESSFCPRCSGDKMTKMLISVNTEDSNKENTFKAKFVYEMRNQTVNLKPAVKEMQCEVSETTVKDLCVRAWSDKVTVNSDSAHGNQ